MQNYYEQFDACREHDDPTCVEACPFNMDFLTVQERIEKGRFNAAYKSMRSSLVFPGIVAELCPAYCEKSCIRQSTGSPVQIRLLEKSVIANASRKKSNAYNLPARKKRVAVIGAGLAGMGFAFKMASKKYDVAVFERSGKIGGRLSQLMDEKAYMAEFDLQFENETYDLNLNSEVTDIKSLCKGVKPAGSDAGDQGGFASGNADNEEDSADSGGYDLIYVATGKGGDAFGVPLPDAIEESGNAGSAGSGCLLMGETGVFVGGELCGKDLMHGLADSFRIAVAAEGFLKTGRLTYPIVESQGHRENPDFGKRQARQDRKNQGCEESQGRGFEAADIRRADCEEMPLTEEECVAEAKRCLRCKCDACDTYCDIVSFFNKMPVKMRDEIFLSCKPAGSLVHKSPARKYVAACTMCGILAEACPEHIDLCGMVNHARHKMHEAEKVPAAYRQYFMRDMAFANSEIAALKKNAPGFGTGNYAFFPGCNLGALDPEYVIRPYRWLLSQEPGMGLLLRCCSVPVDWNGDSTLHDEEIARLRQDWEDLGKPVLIMACMSCQRHINEHLAEIGTISLYEFMAERGFSKKDSPDGQQDSAAAERAENVFSLFDPCSARNRDGVQSAVRTLAAACGVNAEELPEGDKHGCCGFGGMGSIAAPDFAQFVTEKRCELSKNPYLVYCSNCRDVFCDSGKKAIHILDVLFDIDANGTRPQPDLTQRRKNRAVLKERLLDEIWKEEHEMEPYESRYALMIPDEIREKINKQKVLEEDICQVICHAEATGRRTFSPETGHYKAYQEIGHITCWVEYSPANADGGKEAYEIHNVYTHRMRIELEAVFNGRKVDV